MAAVMFNKKPLTPDVVIDETWFSDPVACEELKLWYMIAKTLAEEAAWTFAKENGIDLVTINPGFVIGPLIQPTLTFSLEGSLKIIHGTQIFPDGIYRLVDVRDVANAHIQAFENPAASGRYCIVGGVTHYFEVFKILRKFYPSLRLPEKSEDDKPLQPLYKISQDKANLLLSSRTTSELSPKLRADLSVTQAETRWTCGGDWWSERRLDRTIGVGLDRCRLVGFSVEIGGLPMSPIMASLKITDVADDGFARWMWQ
ncbi:phenylacetaldehyde reductase-like [Quercus suber]|uniref:phenylacetaldehyde reductase-like n=1 Tax=Quercus suber TaxID=58331 RepID=UPI0032DE70B3